LQNQKMFIWMLGAFVATLVVALMHRVAKKPLYTSIVLFMLLAAGIHLFMIPHPLRVVAALPAIITAPVFAASQTPGFLKLLRTARLQHRQPMGGTGSDFSAQVG
jgi:cell division protein FtsW (lipid II flippase)